MRQLVHSGRACNELAAVRVVAAALKGSVNQCVCGQACEARCAGLGLPSVCLCGGSVLPAALATVGAATATGSVSWYLSLLVSQLITPTCCLKSGGPRLAGAILRRRQHCSESQETLYCIVT